jgi:hypothetical protein
VIFCTFVALLAVGWAAAETGNFSSFSTTVTPAGNGLTFDLLLTTTGATDPTASDWVYFALAIGPAYQPTPTGTDCFDLIDNFLSDGLFTGDGDYDLRGLGGNQFMASFSFPGIGPSTAVKWSAWAFYYAGDIDNPAYSTTWYYSIYYFLYSTVCPWLSGPTVTAGSLIWNLVDTDSESPNPDTGVWRQGIIIGSQQGRAIPTLGSWGLLVLGLVVAGAGLLILRRV